MQEDLLRRGPPSVTTGAAIGAPAAGSVTVPAILLDKGPRPNSTLYPTATCSTGTPTVEKLYLLRSPKHLLRFNLFTSVQSFNKHLDRHLKQNLQLRVDKKIPSGATV